MSTRNNIKEFNAYSFFTTVYLAVIFGVYTWILKKKYFNITITRFKFVMYASIVFIVSMLLVIIIDICINIYAKKKVICGLYDDPIYCRPELWTFGFVFSNTIALFMAQDAKSAFYGDKGRYMGLAFMLVFCLVILLCSLGINIATYVFYILAGTSIWAYYVAFQQHIGNDFLKLREGVSKRDYNVFISTFGNINIYASFIVLSTAVFIAMFIFGNKLIDRIVAGIVIFAAGSQILIANSDSIYLGIATIFITTLVLAFNNNRLKNFAPVWIILSGGYLFTTIAHATFGSNFYKREGLSLTIDKPIFGMIAVVVAFGFYFVVTFINNKIKYDKINKKKTTLIFFGILALTIIFVIIVGNLLNLELFNFNYKWGNYRGFIWTKCVKLFEDAPLKNKIFGYGNECVRSLTVSNFKTEMIVVTGRIYDSAHNVILQLLLTTGIVGVVFYVGLIVSTLRYIIKYSNANPVAYMSATAIMAYFAQALINVDQPITTPFLYIFIALGIGCTNGVRKKQKAKER